MILLLELITLTLELAELLVVVVELTLGVDVLEQASGAPPLRVGLHHDCLRPHLLYELLGPLRQHSGKVGSSHQVHLLAPESLRQMHKRGLKAIYPTK